MTYGVDTSVVLRVVTGQPESLAEAVRSRLESLWRRGEVLRICDLVLSETYFALQHSYGISKESAIKVLQKISKHPGFRLSPQADAALRTENLAKASPGFLDRVIHGTYIQDEESCMLSCEKDAKKLRNVEVIKDGLKGER